MKYEHCAGWIRPTETLNCDRSMRSWGNNNPEEHLECMIGLIASSIQQGVCKTEVESCNGGLQIKITDGKMGMTINQNGRFEVYESLESL